jgi:hypothetical protein
MQSEKIYVEQSHKLYHDDGIAVFCGEFVEADNGILADAALAGLQFELARNMPSTVSLFSMNGRNVIGHMRIF